MIERKPDAGRIESHLEKLKSVSWLGPARQWWPNFIFFFADLPNALRILKTGKLVCRSQAEIAVDTGSEKVLNITADEWKDCVRLYFRPRTPTQHQVEGFRPVDKYDSLGKHMPVPIFFLFDAKDILTRKTTRFTTGNLSQNPPIGTDANFFESIPFEKVYHDSLRWTPSFRPQSAENKMGSRGLLSWLFFFVCRSFCALKPFGKERTSRAWHCPSSLSLFFGFQNLPPQAV